MVADLPTPITCKSGGFEKQAQKNLEIRTSNLNTLHLISAFCCTLLLLFFALRLILQPWVSRCTHDPRPRHSRLETEPPPFPSQNSFDELNSAVMSTDFSIFHHTFWNCLAIYGLLIHREIKKQNRETVSWHHKP